LSLIEKLATRLRIIPPLLEESPVARAPSGIATPPFPLHGFPPQDRWDDWEELDAQAWPVRQLRRYSIVPTTCFNCESACGLLAYVDKDTKEVRKFEGNPLH